MNVARIRTLAWGLTLAFGVEGGALGFLPAYADDDRFAGSQLFVQTSANLNVFASNLQLTQNPTVDMAMVFQPRFRLGGGFQLRARAALAYEFTDSDLTQSRNELFWGDTQLQLFYRDIPVLPWGTKVQVAVLVGLPTSKVSQAQTNIFTPGVLAQAFHQFGGVADGTVLLMGTVWYQRPLYENTTPGIRGDDSPVPRQCFTASDTTCTEQASGVANVRDNLSWSAVLLGTWGRVSPALFFAMSHQVPYAFRDLPGVEDVPEGANDARVFTSFSGWVNYNINSWLTAEAGYSMTRNVLNGEGAFGNPIFDQYQDMRVYLGANIGLDRFYRALGGQAEAGGGVIRN